MSKILVGFDIRLGRCEYLTTLWDKKRRSTYLLQPEIEWPLSVDTSVWPSVFYYPHENMRATHPLPEQAISVCARDTRGLALELWSHRDEMESVFAEHKQRLIIKGISVAVVIEDANDLLSEEYWRAVLQPPLSLSQLPTTWRFLGYDIADRYMISGLSNCGYADDEKRLLQPYWSTRLNHFGLLTTLADAREYRQITERRIPQHKPFYIWSLYADVD